MTCIYLAIMNHMTGPNRTFPADRVRERPCGVRGVRDAAIAGRIGSHKWRGRTTSGRDGVRALRARCK